MFCTCVNCTSLSCFSFATFKPWTRHVFQLNTCKSYHQPMSWPEPLTHHVIVRGMLTSYEDFTINWANDDGCEQEQTRGAFVCFKMCERRETLSHVWIGHSLYWVGVCGGSGKAPLKAS